MEGRQYGKEGYSYNEDALRWGARRGVNVEMYEGMRG